MYKSLTISPIPLKTFNLFFNNNLRLCYLGLSDQSLDYLYHRGTVIVPPSSKLYGIYNEKNELISCFQSDYWSEIATSLHVYIPKKNIFQIYNIKNKIIDYLSMNTNYRKVLFFIPSSCDHVISVMDKFKFKLEGRLINSMIWRQTAVDMLIYGLNIKEE